MTSTLHLHIDSLERGPLRLEGALPASVLEMEGDPASHPQGDVTYDLLAEKKGQEVLVRGWVEVPMELECSRSGLFFSTIVRDSAFLRDYSIPESEGHLDLTSDLREAIVLNIPTYPISPEAQSDTFIPPRLPETIAAPPETDGALWKTLDTLNLDKL